MSKNVKNTELIAKKQQKQFSIVYVVGLFLFIILMIFLEGNIFKSDDKKELNLNLKLLETPKVLNINDNNEKGKELDKFLISYKEFQNEIDNLNLNLLSNDKFKYKDKEYKYINENYTHIATNNSLKLLRKGKEVYNIVIEDDITKINLTAETKFYLEYTQNEISFKVNDYTYSIKKLDKYIIECNYKMDGYDVVKEVYDLNWNFINIEINYDGSLYTGYFFDQINGYHLSDDKMYIINENNLDEAISSTKMNDDNSAIYYTVFTYQISSSLNKDLLLVNNIYNFPLK